MASEKTEAIVPEPHEMFKDFMHGRDSYNGLDYDPKNKKVMAFRSEIKAIQKIGHNHGLCEGEVLLLINWLYKRGMVWETIRWGEMNDVKTFVANNATRMPEVTNLARGIIAEPKVSGEQRTDW
jgi:hypothetical protein